MRRADFQYDLPPELIAQHPPERRTASRLLSLDGENGVLRDLTFERLPELLAPGDLLVFNDTRVIPARLFGHKDSGGHVEVLIERLGAEGQDTVLAQVRASKAPRAGTWIELERGVRAEVLERAGEWYRLRFDDPRPVTAILEAIGHVPLPPYIERSDEAADRDRYQTVYARRDGAVAAPTAGLHFDAPMLEALEAQGVESTFVTLHVGAGTFQPMRVESLAEHRMHAEWIEVSQSACSAVAAARARGGRVIAVGTTSVRCLESAARDAGQAGHIVPFMGDTDIFIYPGYRFRAVDAMVTNFHLPESTLLMLVCAFAGYEHVMAAYRHAVAQRYRFFSYGDAMFVTRQT